MHVRVYVPTGVHIRSCVCICLLYIPTYIQMVMYLLYVSMHMLASMYEFMEVGGYACTYACVHAYMHVRNVMCVAYGCVDGCMRACMHVCMYVCMYACIESPVCTHAYIYVCMYEM